MSYDKISTLSTVQDTTNNNVLSPTLSLVEAAKRGQTEVVSSLLLEGKEDPTYNKNEALLEAAQSGHDQVVKLLLQDKRVNPMLSPYLMDAAILNYRRNPAVLQVILEDGRVDPIYYTMDLASSRSERMVILLIADGRAKLVPNNVFTACYHKDPSLVRLLIKYVNPEPVALVYAVDDENLEIVKILLEDRRIDPSVCGNKALRWAAKRGHVDVVLLLLHDLRVDPSYSDQLPLKKAAAHGHEEIVFLLLADKRVDPTYKRCKSIRVAANRKQERIVRLLVQDSRVDPTDRESLLSLL